MKKEYLKEEPDAIFVVVWDGKHRIYVSEGQAVNWFTKKIEEGYKAKLFSYTKDSQLGG